MRNNSMDAFLLELKVTLMNHYQCESGDAELRSNAHYKELLADVREMSPSQIKAWVRDYLKSHNDERIATKEEKKEWDKYG